MRGTKKEVPPVHRDSPACPVCEYLWDTYKVDDPRVIALVKRNLSPCERTGLRWHATVAAANKLLVVSENSDALRKIVVLGFNGQKRVFREISL